MSQKTRTAASIHLVDAARLTRLGIVPREGTSAIREKGNRDDRFLPKAGV